MSINVYKPVFFVIISKKSFLLIVPPRYWTHTIPPHHRLCFLKLKIYKILWLSCCSE